MQSLHIPITHKSLILEGLSGILEVLQTKITTVRANKYAKVEREGKTRMQSQMQNTKSQWVISSQRNKTGKIPQKPCK